MRIAVLLLFAVALAGCGATAPPGPGPGDGGPRDALRDRQWSLDLMHAEEAWAHATGKGVLIAVLDTGADDRHEDLQGRLVFNLDADFVDPAGPDGPRDECFHGTATAGLAGAAANNGVGIAGMAPDAMLLPVRVINDCRQAEVPQEEVTTLALFETRVAAGIRYAADQGADVISMSFVYTPYLPVDLEPINAAVDYAWSKGAVLVAGAGNNGLPLCLTPAGNPNVLCVGATTKDDVVAGYSNTARDATHVMAPGGGQAGPSLPGSAASCDDAIVTLDTGLGKLCPPAPGYFAANGTSFATPLVAGVAALLVEQGLGNEAVVQRLRETAVDLGEPGPDDVYGFGRVDALAAVLGNSRK